MKIKKKTAKKELSEEAIRAVERARKTKKKHYVDLEELE